MRQGESGRALIVGGDSLVGSALQAHCRKAGIAVDWTSRRPGAGGIPLDLSNPDFAPLDRTDYSVAYLCAAVTSMQACQAKPESSRRINVDNTLALMRRLAGRGTHFVFLSSSQVFDGETPAPDEGAETCPKNEYGTQKLAVEQAIAREGLPVAVLRPTKVLAEQPVGVFKGWFDALSQGKPASAATNMALSPVMVADVADAAVRLAGGGHRGIWHLGSSDEIGYYDAARLMAESRGLPLSLVKGEDVTEAQVPSIFRHRHVTLSCDKIARSLGMPVKRARVILDALFAGFPQPVASAAR
ncbi:MAG: sugar nucleotide-binding protein [Reyranella sp.]|jgi:dTDP-4-dehydrorhamnose reductase|nr:sugar nucleotide-binding protein [Reyranella sp.]